MYLARHELDADTFLFNCDILFHPQVLERMLAAAKPNVVAVDSLARRVAHEMNVALDREKRVRVISKELDPAQAQATSIQLVKFDAAGARTVGQEVERLIQEQHRNAFPTSTYGPLIQAGQLFAVEAGDLPWTEIDSLADYHRALSEILPRLKRV